MARRDGLIALSVAGMSAMSAPASANDTTAQLGAGGLIIGRSDQIAMESEDLFISPEKVTVDYVFRNNSDKDVETLVAFPMPDIEGSPYANVDIPVDASDNFLGFSVSIDGQEVKPELQHSAFAVGLDIGKELDANGVPYFPFGDATLKALEKLSSEVAADWQNRGLIALNEYDDGSGMKSVREPLWQLHSAYWWRASFPAGKPVKVAHSYKPSVGGTAGVSFYTDGKFQGQYDGYKRKYCLDESFERAVEKAAKNSGDGFPPYTETWLSYVLTTGGNWALGTIGKFRLTIDKGDPANIVSFCGAGVKKVGLTTFEMTATDFYPERDIEILILQPYDSPR
ncbi:DUF4424 domain-containing protein [Aminobacter sp. SR38]|jgi:hypothetical protein|uniref:DUF4424 domain-containing protein n=1 Tax=Aminobacter sp. SR38 TaxID=2774562 RepID=UPI001FEF7D0E|nr:DUF4424 domain-containing protein [Aminobacter sp. SR38]